MVILKSRSNYKEQKDKYPDYFTGEIFLGKSKTVPNQTKSMRELLAMHTRGQFINTHEGTYDDDQEDLPDFSKMDRFEKIEYARALKNDIIDFREEMLSKAEQRKLDKQHAEWLKQQEKSKEDEPTDPL